MSVLPVKIETARDVSSGKRPVWEGGWLRKASDCGKCLIAKMAVGGRGGAGGETDGKGRADGRLRQGTKRAGRRFGREKDVLRGGGRRAGAGRSGSGGLRIRDPGK